MKTLMFTTLLALATTATAQPVPAVALPADTTTPAPVSDRGERDGFSGHLLVTAESDWRERWNTPGQSKPRFSQASEVRIGGQLHILVFLANPAPGLGNRADVRCDVKVVRPDGSLSLSRRDLVCFQGLVAADPAHEHLAAPTMTFNAEPTDQRGRWLVQVVLHDRNRSVEVPLEAAFSVLD